MTTQSLTNSFQPQLESLEQICERMRDMKIKPPVGKPEEREMVLNDLFTKAERIKEAYHIEFDKRAQRSGSSWLPTALYNPLSGFQEEVEKVNSTFRQILTLRQLLMRSPEFRLPSKEVYSRLDQFFQYLPDRLCGISNCHYFLFWKKIIVKDYDHRLVPGTQHYDYEEVLKQFAQLTDAQMLEFFGVVAGAQRDLAYFRNISEPDKVFSGVVFLSLCSLDQIQALARSSGMIKELTQYELELLVRLGADRHHLPAPRNS
jgi:hypothetical protein